MMGSNYGLGTTTMMGGSGAWGWLLICIGIVFLFLIVVGLLFMFIAMMRRSPKERPPVAESPLDILNRRYASGEIDKTEYEQRKKDLS